MQLTTRELHALHPVDESSTKLSKMSNVRQAGGEGGSYSTTEARQRFVELDSQLRPVTSGGVPLPRDPGLVSHLYTSLVPNSKFGSFFSEGTVLFLLLGPVVV